MKQPICAHWGGWQADGKGPSIWDTFCHEKGGRVFGEQDGDVGCNSYELWEQDLECIKQLGLTHYRLSVSWARLLPDGTTRHVNQKGIPIHTQHVYLRQQNGISCVAVLPYYCSSVYLPYRCAVLQQGDWWFAGLQCITHGHTLPLWLASSSPRSRWLEIPRNSGHLWQLCKVLLPNIWWPHQALDHHQRALCVRQIGPWGRHPCPGIKRTGGCCLHGGP